MTRHIKVGIQVGVVGFLAEMFLIFIFMGLPIGGILIAIPIGIITARKVARGTDLKQAVSDRPSLRAGLISGSLSSLGIVAPLLFFAIITPPQATLRAELQKLVNPVLIPGFINNLRTALTLGGILSALVATGLTVSSCLLTAKHLNRG